MHTSDFVELLFSYNGPQWAQFDVLKIYIQFQNQIHIQTHKLQKSMKWTELKRPLLREGLIIDFSRPI